MHNNDIVFVIYNVFIIITVPTTKVAKKPDARKLTTTSTTSTTTTTGLRRSSPQPILKLGRMTSSSQNVKKVSVVLTQAGPDMRDSNESRINQLIDSIMDNDVLSLNGIAVTSS